MSDHHVRLVNLPTSVRGLCYHDDNGDEFIVLNARLTWEQNVESYKHELKHIENGDIYNEGYVEYRKDNDDALPEMREANPG